MICNFSANMQYSCNGHPNNKVTSSQIHNSHQELFWFTLFACKVPGLRGREEFCHKLLQSQVTEVVMLKRHLCNPLVRRRGIQKYLYLWVLKSWNINEKNASNVYWTVHHCNSWQMKDQLDVTCYFISLIMRSTCFGH